MCLICALTWSGEAWGQTYYVAERASEEDLYTATTGETISLNGPGATIIFWAKHRNSINPKVEIHTSTDNGANWTVATSFDVSSSYTEYKYNISSNVNAIRFRGRGTVHKWVKDVKVTRATTLSASNVSFGEVKLNKTQSETAEVTYSNGFNPQTFSATTTSPGFTVTNISDTKITAATGKVTVTYSFTPTEAKNYSGTATLKLGSTTITISLSGTGTINKANPTFTWNMPSTAYAKRTYREFFSTTNDEVSPSVTSTNENIAKYVGGNLYFPGGTGSVTITISQIETTNFFAKSESYNLTVEEAQNHVPFTIDNSTKYNLFVTSTNSNNRNAYDGGIRLGGNSNVVDDLISAEKYVIIEFSGIPDKLTFTTSVGGIAPTGIGFYVQEIDEDGFYSSPNLWESSSKDNTVNKQLKPTTRALKVAYTGNYWAFIKNLTVTELRYLTVDKTSLDFSTNTKGNSVATQTFTVSHCNAGNNVSITSNNSNFTVSPSVLNTTGGDLMGTETVTVRYQNNTTGVNNGTITISDPNGTNANVTLTVTGTTQTIYYTRAEAHATTGGNAYVSFVSSAAATETSITKNSGLTTDLEATNNAYWRAEASDGYRFVEWQWPNGTQASVNASDKWEGYTYDSEDINNPTLVEFTAIFEPKSLILNPGTTPGNDIEGLYKGDITLSRTLKAGYSTIALPFDTDVSELVAGRNEAYDSSADWVAQLSAVTSSVADGYTLYFQKVENGVIEANQPYVLHLGTQVVNPTWTDTTNGITVATASAASVTPSTGYSGYAGWTMYANYETNFPMDGKYGIVNNSQLTGTDKTTYLDGGLMLGSGDNAKLNAFTAYITGPTSGTNGAPRLRVAYVDEDGTATFIGSLPQDGEQGEPVAVYGPDGQRRNGLQRGVNIVRYADGTTRKVQY